MPHFAPDDDFELALASDLVARLRLLQRREVGMMARVRAELQSAATRRACRRAWWGRRHALVGIPGVAALEGIADRVAGGAEAVAFTSTGSACSRLLR